MVFKRYILLLFTLLSVNSIHSKPNNRPIKYKTVYYFTQQTSHKNGHIVLSFVKSVSCEWGYRGKLAIERVVKEDYKNWARFKSWNKEYRSNVYVYESKSNAQNARNRIRSSTGVYDDNDKYYDSYSYDCDYHIYLDEEKAEERERKGKEEEERKIKEERDRLAAEQTKIKKEKEAAEEKIRYNNWVNTSKKTFQSKLDDWDLKAKQYINEINKKHKIFNGEQLPTYLDIYDLLIEKTLVSQTISVEEKSNILQRVLIDTYNYYYLYYNYNYKKAIPYETLEKIKTIYVYGKAHFGYHPATNAYSFLSGITISPHQYTPISKKIEEKDISCFNKNKPNIALFEYFSVFENFNRTLEEFTYSRQFVSHELQWRINLGYLLYYNGYYYDAYKILNKERTIIDLQDKNFKKTNYWEIYSYEIAALYYTSNYDIAIKEAEKFEKGLFNQYPKKKLKDLSTIKIARNKNSLPTDDISVQNAYSRVLVFWSKSLLRKKEKKASAKIINPIVKLIKKETPIDYFGNNDNQLTVLLKEHEPKLYLENNLQNASNNFNKIHQTYDKWEKINGKKTWEEINANKINDFYKSYNEKKYEAVETIGKELLPSLRYDFVKGNEVYKEIMTKSAIASAVNKNYVSGICFSNYALKSTTKEKEEDIAYLLLLTNVILGNNYTYIIDRNNPYIEPKDNNQKYNFESLLTTIASKKFNGEYGYQMLENITKELSKKDEKSIYLPYIYNAINKAKKNR